VMLRAAEVLATLVKFKNLAKTNLFHSSERAFSRSKDSLKCKKN